MGYTEATQRATERVVAIMFQLTSEGGEFHGAHVPMRHLATLIMQDTGASNSAAYRIITAAENLQLIAAAPSSNRSDDRRVRHLHLTVAGIRHYHRHTSDTPDPLTAAS